MNAMLWIAYNAAGDLEASDVDAQTAADALVENHGHDEGFRVVALNLTLPDITPIEATATITAADRPVVVSIRS